MSQNKRHHRIDSKPKKIAKGQIIPKQNQNRLGAIVESVGGRK